ncbi:hypothetical protein G3N59_05515 [Paraburkholderia sp. Ac-20340]|uniref:hypothetical protein n=1 Tax=Paraburkholderia sp. Ac-20340 TaxID=2703888 RepID=UPI00197D3552|nr:hypothetical protein [Paraburkholderia sp. Ac-20340]MBN3852833.1 hypothetical protein [Paraburkholderia sp. Ac-20340]
MIAWHYTTAQCFRGIEETGGLLPSAPHMLDAEKPLLWFSVNQHWEQSARRGWTENGKRRLLSLEEMILHFGALYRFGMHELRTAIGERQIRRLGRIRPGTWDQMIKNALAMGSDPNEWRACSAFVPIGYVQVQVLKNLQTGWEPAR